MIHRDGYNGPITFECDACEEAQLDTGHDDFKEALAALRHEGWTVRKIGQDWFHFCSFECQKQTTRENKPELPKVHNMSRSDAARWLGLPDHPDKEQTKQAYRRIIQLCHPDKGGTTALGQLINEAYDILKD
jgi:hypothetical protein